MTIAHRQLGLCANLAAGGGYDDANAQTRRNPRRRRGRLQQARGRGTDLGLKNIAEPIRVYSLGADGPAQVKSPMPPELVALKKRAALAPFAAGVAALLIVIACGAWYFFTANRPAAEPREGAHWLTCSETPRRADGKVKNVELLQPLESQNSHSR